jgi:PIN domain nuclease of toxin-antitoxin system
LNLLIDTHVLIWLDTQPDRVRRDARRALDDGANTVFVSAASAWEIGAKKRKGKLHAKTSASSFIQRYDVQELVVSVADGELAGELDWPNPDPFDRMILAQAERRGMTLVTSDGLMRSYERVAMIFAG